jgi:hypothetical protein
MNTEYPLLTAMCEVFKVKVLSVELGRLSCDYLKSKGAIEVTFDTILPLPIDRHELHWFSEELLLQTPQEIKAKMVLGIYPSSNRLVNLINKLTVD